MIREFNLTEDDVQRLCASTDDLKVQSMMFDMDVDWETAQLTEKVKDETPIWIKRWNAKRRAADFNERFDIPREN